jgi:hypothetical protein
VIPVDLIQGHLDGTLGEEETLRLARLLQSDAEAREAFARALRQDVLLGEVLSEAAPSARAGIRRPLLVAAAACLLIAIGLALWLPRPGSTLEDAVGDVRFDGTSLETPAGGSARVLLPDGTRLHAGTETRLTLGKGRIDVLQGTLAADVAPQAASLVFATPQAEARVLGTRLVLAVEPNETVCKVDEGHVRLVSRTTGQAVDVKGGHYAIAAPQGELKAEPLAPPPASGRPSVFIVEPNRWPKSYSTYTFRKDALIYKDRGYRITTLPEELDGATGIATLAADKASPEERLLVFKIDREAEVWVGIDARAAKDARKLPAWLHGWEATGLKAHSKTAGNSTYHFYRKRYPAGSVSLGGNHHGGDTGAGVNYLVVITAPR